MTNLQYLIKTKMTTRIFMISIKEKKGNVTGSYF